MLRKMFSLGALVVVAVTFGAGNAAAKPKNAGPPQGNGNGSGQFSPDGFSDGRFMQGGQSSEGFSDGR
jgi:hypothetical protein